MERVTGIHSISEYPGKLSEAARGDLEELFNKVFPKYFKDVTKPQESDRIESSWAMLVHNPELAVRVARLSDYIVHQMPWCQRADMRELMIQTVALHFGCDYCFFAHFDWAADVGIGADLQAALPFWRTSSFFTEEQRTVIEFTHASIEGTVSNELFAKARELFGEKGVLEFTVAVAYWSFWSIILNTLRPTLNFGHTKPVQSGKQPG